MSGLGKVVRAFVGVVIIIAILLVMNSWYGQYKIAARKAALASKTATSTASSIANSGSASVTPVQGQHAAILTAGVPLNQAAADGARTLRTLKKGEVLVLMGVASNNWLQVRDTSGQIGYVLNSPTLVKVQK